MRFTAFKNRYCLNLDWLQYSVLLHEKEPEILCPEGYRVELCPGNNIFANRALVYDGRGAKVLTLLWQPYSKVLNPLIMTVQVANEYLYMSGMGVKWAHELVQQIVECTFNAVGRFDVCLDWVASEKRLQFLRHLNSGHYYVQRKSEGSMWWHEISKNNFQHQQLHCLSWGSKKSEIKVKIYNKSREQGVINGDSEPEKPWIVAEWRNNDMDISQVWRLEFSFSGAGQLRWNNKTITLENLQDDTWLVGVFLECYHDRFVTRINQGHARDGHKNNDTRVYLLQLPIGGKSLSWSTNENKQHEIPPAITLLRAMMRQLDNPCIMSVRPTFEDFANTILNFVRDQHLEGYFRRTYDCASDDYFNELWKSVGNGVHTSTPSPSLLMD